jgi:outer membrane protein, heavy metal efflux system
MTSRWWAAAGFGLILASCMHYVPRPKPPEKVAASFVSRSFEDTGLQEALNKALPARSADWPRSQWDRADLLFAMLYFNDSVAEGRAAVDVATAGRVTARQLPNPTVQLNGEYANQHDGSPLWLWGVTTDWLLDYGLRRGVRISEADLSEQQARYDFAELAWKTRVALRRALVDMLLAEREVTLLEQMQGDRASQLQMARRQLELGAVGRGEVDRLVSDALLDEQKLNDSRRHASAARSAVAAAVGVPVEALEKIRLSWSDLDTPQEIPEERMGQWREQSLLERGDVRSAVVAYSVSEAALQLEVRKQYPDITLGPGYTWDHGVKRVQFNLILTLPLLNRNRGPIAEAEARRQEAGAKLEATVAEAYSQIDEGIRQWRLARVRLTEAHGSIYETAQRIYSEMEQGFAAGANDRTELVAAGIARTLTELQVLDAVRGAQEALGELEDAMRRPLEGPELSFDATKWRGRQ